MIRETPNFLPLRYLQMGLIMLIMIIVILLIQIGLYTFDQYQSMNSLEEQKERITASLISTQTRQRENFQSSFGYESPQSFLKNVTDADAVSAVESIFANANSQTVATIEQYTIFERQFTYAGDRATIEAVLTSLSHHPVIEFHLDKEDQYQLYIRYYDIIETTP